MNRKIIILIILCALIIVNSCGTTKEMISLNVDSFSASLNENKNFSINKKLAPRQYEGSNDSTLISIIINESIDTIPEWCFSRIPSLEAVLLKGKDIVVESNAFYACKNLQTINLNNVIRCGEGALKMTSIDSISLRRCEYIEDFAFANCPSLCYASLSDSLKHIGDFAFSSDTTLVKINVPNGEIGSCSFMGCSKLQNVKLGNVCVIGESAFLDCTSLCEITIPKSVLEIGSEAFAGCSNLKVVRVTNRQTVIANNAFDSNTVIEYIN